jgi:hypothetical protein
VADPYHHALSSVRRWGGEVSDYLELHRWFDQTKDYMPDFRHRALRHHAEGIALCIRLFGPTLTLSSGRVIPTRWVAEQHVSEDLGRVPSAQDWLENLRARPWMTRARRLSRELEESESAHTSGAAQVPESQVERS